jgi:ST7 protein
MSLFRGAEYQRYAQVTNKEPLTYYDMNLSAQDHQTFFSCDCDVGRPEFESECRFIIRSLNFFTIYAD